MKMLQTILDCVYPKRCPVCHDIVMPKGRQLCEKCKDKIRILHEPRCKKCSKMLADDQGEYCGDCTHSQHLFEEGCSVFPYDSQMQRSMMLFKFHGRREYGVFYGEMILRFTKGKVTRWKPEVLIPVPMHRRKQKRRGYNQAEIIGRALSEGFSIPIRTDLVSCVQYTKAQKELNYKARRKNLLGAFEVKEQVKEYRSVLLVDDVYTTGSTIDEITRILKKSGVKEVFFVTVCIGSGF